jgi:hypothetical protein
MVIHGVGPGRVATEDGGLDVWIADTDAIYVSPNADVVLRQALTVWSVMWGVIGAEQPARIVLHAGQSWSNYYIHVQATLGAVGDLHRAYAAAKNDTERTTIIREIARTSSYRVYQGKPMLFVKNATWGDASRHAETKRSMNTGEQTSRSVNLVITYKSLRLRSSANGCAGS